MTVASDEAVTAFPFFLQRHDNAMAGTTTLSKPQNKPQKETVRRRIKPSREDLPKDVNLCEHCTAKCCRYFALPLETPTSREEFESLRWFLLHEQATAFTEEGEWYVCIHTVCKHLQPDNRCGIYETRPPICREYTTDNCEYEDDWVYDQYFETAEQVVEYMEAVLGPGGEEIGDGRKKKNRRRSIRSSKPPLLPLLAG